MKRSEMKELIKKELTKTMGSDAAKSVAEDVLHLVEQAGMHPPDAVLNDGQTGKYWDNKWEEEAKKLNRGHCMISGEPMD